MMQVMNISVSFLANILAEISTNLNCCQNEIDV